MKSILAVFILAVAAWGCKKNCLCPEEAINLAFVGYSDSELDSIVVTLFQKGRNFTEVADSFYLDTDNSVRSRSGDTTTVVITDLSKRLTDRYDSRVFNAFDNRTILITDVKLDRRPVDCGSAFGGGPPQCTSPVTAFKQNGVPATPDEFGTFRGLIIRK